MFERFLNPILSPLLKLGYFWAILIMSFVLTLIVTVVYKYTTNQTLMKKLKKELKDMQKDIKKHKDNPTKAMSIQKKMMEKNMQYMKHSMKPTLYTFIPIIIIFGWLTAHLAYHPILPNEPFDVKLKFKSGTFGEANLSIMPEGVIILSNTTQTISKDEEIIWTLNGTEGNYELTFTFANRMYKKDLLISSNEVYATPELPVRDSEISKISIMNKRVRPIEDFGIKGGPNWIWTYILLSLGFSFGLRKLMDLA